MKEIKLNKDNRAEVLQAALEVLKRGGTVVYPTETSYGLGCDFYNQAAIVKVYEIKQRNQKKPFPVIVPDITSATVLVDFSEGARRLALEHWPGPLTLVLPFKYCKWQEHCDDFLALRVSSHPFAKELVESIGNPIISTSANVSKTGDAYSPDEVKKQFDKALIKPDLFVNAGELSKRAPSTIVKFFGNKGEVLRQGEIKVKV